jgi:pyroglutamyl-peptidase
MTATILITGFGPFPGAPSNPTEPLVKELAHRRHPAFAHVRRVAHVFPVSYEAVDRELPALLERERPEVLLMFGLASRTKHVRVETRARNALTRLVPDADGQVPVAASIVPGAPTTVPLRAPAWRLVLAARGRYLCNYLCWRAAEAARAGGPRLVAFIHVPSLRRIPVHRPALTLEDLAQAGEAILRTALVSRFRSSHIFAAPSDANFGITGTLATL